MCFVHLLWDGTYSGGDIGFKSDGLQEKVKEWWIHPRLELECLGFYGEGKASGKIRHQSKPKRLLMGKPRSSNQTYYQTLSVVL